MTVMTCALQARSRRRLATAVPVFSGIAPALRGGAMAIAGMLLAAACSSDPAPDMVSRAMQSNMPPPTTVTPTTPGTGGAPPSVPTGGRGPTGGTGGATMPAIDGGAPAVADDAGSDAAVDAGPGLTMCADDD